MKILVCISHVPDTTSKINFCDENKSFDSDGIQFIINPNDEFGLIRAIWFKEKMGATVDVLNVGLKNTEQTLRKALAIGADKAVRINTNPKCSKVVSKSIAKYLESNKYDLIIMGRESIDYNGGMVPGMVSALSSVNFIDKCTSLDIDNSNVKAVREIEGGVENISTSLPLIISSQKGLVEEKDLRIPNMRGIMMARKKELIVIEDYGFKISSVTVKFEKPSTKNKVTLIPSDNVDKLIELLNKEAKVI